MKKSSSTNIIALQSNKTHFLYLFGSKREKFFMGGKVPDKLLYDKFLQKYKERKYIRTKH